MTTKRWRSVVMSKCRGFDVAPVAVPKLAQLTHFANGAGFGSAIGDLFVDGFVVHRLHDKIPTILVVIGQGVPFNSRDEIIVHVRLLLQAEMASATASNVMPFRPVPGALVR